MALIVGIDLGTTYTVISYIDSKSRAPQIIKNKNGNLSTPSVIGFTSPDSYVIGEDAKAMEEVGDVNTASFYKLHMGDHNYKISILGKDYTAMDLSSMFLKRLIEEAEETMGDEITKAVITVPAYFEDAAKNDTIAAGRAAGLDVMNIINEPTAACVAYGLRNDSSDKKILIYDLGGGTFDVTIANVSKDSINVIGTIGHHQLGGRDWDAAIADWLTERFQEETGIDASEDSEFAAENMIKAEIAKRQLTTASSADIFVDNGEKKCKIRLTRQEFEDMTSYQLGITINLINELFENIKLSWNDIDGAVFVGGSTKMPMVRNFIISKNIKILDGVNPDESVAIGAAIQANISTYCATLPGNATISSFAMEQKDLDLVQLPGAKTISDVIPHSLGMIVESADGHQFVNDIMIPRNTSREKAFETKRRQLRVSRKKEDNRLDIYLLQGESEEPINCTVAKKYSFYDIEYVTGGKTVLDITFLHTINGTIDVKAVQSETGVNLKCREEDIPADMSWVTKSPREVFGSPAKSEISGVLVMALDLSGSMAAMIQGVKAPDLPGGLAYQGLVVALDLAKSAMINFVDQFSDVKVKIGIIGFSDMCMVMCEPTDDKKIIMEAIGQLKVQLTGVGNDASPLQFMYDMMKPFVGEPFAYALVLTDGMWNSHACDCARRMQSDFKRMGFEVIGMGFGDADEEFLKDISTRTELANVDDITNLDSSLSSIARIMLD